MFCWPLEGWFFGRQETINKPNQSLIDFYKKAKSKTIFNAILTGYMPKAILDKSLTNWFVIKIKVRMHKVITNV